MASRFPSERQSRAIVTRPVNQWSLEEVTLRAIGDDELLVQVVATGICHTDLKIAKRSQQADRILGHEG